MGGSQLQNPGSQLRIYPHRSVRASCRGRVFIFNPNIASFDMKILFAILALSASLAQANTIYPLQKPADLPAGNQPGGRYCVGHAFVGDLVTGTCQSLVAVGSRLPNYTATVYAAVWDLAGNVKGDTFCGTAVQASRSYPAKWTYQPGYDAESCYLPTPPVYEPVLIGYGWYGYITTSPDGAYELLTSGHDGVINQF